MPIILGYELLAGFQPFQNKKWAVLDLVAKIIWGK